MDSTNTSLYMTIIFVHFLIITQFFLIVNSLNKIERSKIKRPLPFPLPFHLSYSHSSRITTIYIWWIRSEISFSMYLYVLSICKYIFMCINTYIHTYAYVCVYKQMYIYTYLFIHSTHIWASTVHQNWYWGTNSDQTRSPFSWNLHPNREIENKSIKM